MSLLGDNISNSSSAPSVTLLVNMLMVGDGDDAGDDASDGGNINLNESQVSSF